MSQQLLDVAQVGAAVEQVCRERMAQRVRADVVHPRTDANVLINHPAHGAGRDARPLIVQKQRLLIAFRYWRVEQKLVTNAEILSNRIAGRIAKRHDPLLPSFSRDAYQLIAKVDVSKV